MIIESGTSSPRSMYPAACLPSSVPAAFSARRMSPLDRCRACESSAQALGLRTFARTRRTQQDRYHPRTLPGCGCLLTEEAAVVPHDQVRLDPLDGIQADADHDQQTGAAQERRDRVGHVQGLDASTSGTTAMTARNAAPT